MGVRSEAAKCVFQKSLLSRSLVAWAPSSYQPLCLFAFAAYGADCGREKR